MEFSQCNAASYPYRTIKWETSQNIRALGCTFFIPITRDIFPVLRSLSFRIGNSAAQLPNNSLYSYFQTRLHWISPRITLVIGILCFLSARFFILDSSSSSHYRFAWRIDVRYLRTHQQFFSIFFAHTYHTIARAITRTLLWLFLFVNFIYIIQY